MKYSRSYSFKAIAIGYILALLLGIAVCMLTWNRLPYLWSLFIADAVATLFIWAIGLVYRNVSYYDPYWSVAPPLMLTGWAIYCSSFTLPVIMLLLAVWIWAIRLTYNWIYTFKGLDHEDWRYTKFRDMCPAPVFQLINFFGLNMMPTVVVFLVMIPGFEIICLPESVSVLSVVGFMMSIGAVTIQYVSDKQAHEFREKNPGKVCNVGIWKNGRHPNYFGEILMWFGVLVMYLGSCSTFNIWYISGAFTNLLMFCCISVPLMESRQLKNKPEYRDYKKSTRMFI